MAAMVVTVALAESLVVTEARVAMEGHTEARVTPAGMALLGARVQVAMQAARQVARTARRVSKASRRWTEADGRSARA